MPRSMDQPGAGRSDDGIPGSAPRQGGRGGFPISRHGKRSAFSLIEVIMAVAVFAVSITVILALLPGLTGRGVETGDRLVATRLPAALQAELARLAIPDFDALAGQVPVMSAP